MLNPSRTEPAATTTELNEEQRKLHNETMILVELNEGSSDKSA
jgi:hypothetical protein